MCLFVVYPVVSWWMRGGRFGGVGFGNGGGMFLSFRSLFHLYPLRFVSFSIPFSPLVFRLS